MCYAWAMIRKVVKRHKLGAADARWQDRDYWLNLEVSFIGRDAFITNKRASGRTRDLADLEDLGET
jgi:hypothetical protein